MKKLAAIAAVTALTFGVANAETGTHKNIMKLKIGVINPVKIYQTVPQGEKSVNMIYDTLKPKADALAKKHQGLLVRLQKLQANLPTLTKSAVSKQKDQLEQQQELFKKEAISFRQQEMKQTRDVADLFQKTFDKAVAKLAKKGHYNLVLSSQAVAYASPSLKVDLTNDVIDTMNSMSSDKKHSTSTPAKPINMTQTADTNTKTVTHN